MHSDSEKPHAAGFDTRALAVTALLIVAMGTTALLADGPLRDDTLLSVFVALEAALLAVGVGAGQ